MSWNDITLILGLSILSLVASFIENEQLSTMLASGALALAVPRRPSPQAPAGIVNAGTAAVGLALVALIAATASGCSPAERCLAARGASAACRIVEHVACSSGGEMSVTGPADDIASELGLTEDERREAIRQLDAARQALESEDR